MDIEYARASDQLMGLTIGNYLVKQKLGVGGMGSVYLAEHPHIGRRVALKVLHAEFASNPNVVARFFNEAKAVNDIGHPNIVDVLDYGMVEVGRERFVYFIMEYLSGQTLADIIRQEALPPERALGIAMQVADALSASHRCNIVHRDLKPDNIMLQPRGRERDFVKLLDFGIAKLTGDQSGSQRTRTGIVMGTPAYMSPEQCEGKGNIDHRTDVYALGIVLYEMLTGRVPFIGEGYGEILVQHLTQQPASPSTFRLIPPHVEAVVLKALAKNPNHRFPNMDEFMRAMADPVRYVEDRGGVVGFLDREIQPVTDGTPLPTAVVPASALTPPPGSLQAASALPTISPNSSDHVAPVATNKKTKFIVGGVGVVAIALVAVVLAGGGGKTSTSNVAGPGAGTASLPANVPDAATVTTQVAPDAAPAVATVTPDAAPAPRKIKITIEANIPGAIVKLGEVTGPSPFTTDVEVASTMVPTPLEVTARGYTTHVSSVDLKSIKSDSFALQIDLEKKSKKGPNQTNTNGTTTTKPIGETTIAKPGEL